MIAKVYIIIDERYYDMGNVALMDRPGLGDLVELHFDVPLEGVTPFKVSERVQDVQHKAYSVEAERGGASRYANTEYLPVMVLVFMLEGEDIANFKAYWKSLYPTTTTDND